MTEIYDLFQQGRTLLEQGHAAQALVPLEKAKRRAPDKASIRERLGIAYFRLRRYEEAESEFRALLELAPTDDYGHYALGRCLEKRGLGPRGERPLQARELPAPGLETVRRSDQGARAGDRPLITTESERQPPFSPMTLRISSTDVTPFWARRAASWRMVRMPCSTAAAKISSVELSMMRRTRPRTSSTS